MAVGCPCKNEKRQSIGEGRVSKCHELAVAISDPQRPAGPIEIESDSVGIVAIFGKYLNNTNYVKTMMIITNIGEADVQHLGLMMMKKGVKRSKEVDLLILQLFVYIFHGPF